MNNPIKLYTQITKFDVETQIRQEFNTCKELNRNNVSNIVSLNKSRGKKIIFYIALFFYKIIVKVL